MYKQEEISDYYDQTQVHYEYFWDLEKSKSLHYGMWDENTRNFKEALANTNQVLAKKVNITKKDHVLDVGCGVGGSCFYLAQNYQCKTTGISLSQKQIDQANAFAKNSGLQNQVHFEKANHCHTPFPDAAFDVIWGIESHLSEINKEAFFAEAYRLLKPGGRLIIADYLKTNHKISDKEEKILTNWLNCWAIKEIVSEKDFSDQLQSVGFHDILQENVNKAIAPSAKRMFYSSFMGFFGTKLYQLYNSKASRFSKIHYKSGWYQYKALKKGLWSYQIIQAKK